MRTATSLLLVLILMTAGCGDGEPDAGGGKGAAASGSKQDQARAVVEEIFALVKSGKREELAGHVAYRGREDKKRRWTDSSNYADPDEKRNVDQVFSRVEFLHTKGEPHFERFHAEKESEGEWLVWHVRFGEGDDAKNVAFACINNGGKTLLGDID